LLNAYGEANIKNAGKSFFNRVIFSASQNGDSKEFAKTAKQIASIISKLKEKMTVDGFDALRNGDKNKFILNVLENFDENEWEEFDSAMPRNIDTEKYIALATEWYGEAFEVYLESYEVATLEELKASCGTQDFYKTLKEYVAGICPAFSYSLMR
jgi:hypothetical protein